MVTGALEEPIAIPAATGFATAAATALCARTGVARGGATNEEGNRRACGEDRTAGKLSTNGSKVSTGYLSDGVFRAPIPVPQSFEMKVDFALSTSPKIKNIPVTLASHARRDRVACLKQRHIPRFLPGRRSWALRPAGEGKRLIPPPRWSART